MYYYVEQRYRTAWKNESKNKLVVKYVFTLALTVVISLPRFSAGGYGDYLRICKRQTMHLIKKHQIDMCGLTAMVFKGKI